MNKKTNLNAYNLCPLASSLLLSLLLCPASFQAWCLSAAIAPASVAGFYDSNSIAKNYLRFSLPAEALAQAGSTAAYIEPPACRSCAWWQNFCVPGLRLSLIC
jgi:hypothetical protein